MVYPQACTLTKQINCAPFPASITKKLRNYEKKSELLVQFCGFISHCYFFLFSFCRDAPAQSRYITEGRKREAEEKEGARKLQLAEVFGLNSENDPFSSDGL